MTAPRRVVILGATGALGKHVGATALRAGHQVTVIVRTPARLPVGWRDRVAVHAADLTAIAPAALAALLDGHDLAINTAGKLGDGDRFVALVDRLVTALEALPPDARPAAWFTAGAGLLELGDSGRTGMDLPGVRALFWPHGANLRRLQASTIDWRLLCPGPMLEGPALGPARTRLAIDRLPMAGPPLPAAWLLPRVMAQRGAMTVPYADAAAAGLTDGVPRGSRVGVVRASAAP